MWSAGVVIVVMMIINPTISAPLHEQRRRTTPGYSIQSFFVQPADDKTLTGKFRIIGIKKNGPDDFEFESYKSKGLDFTETDAVMEEQPHPSRCKKDQDTVLFAMPRFAALSEKSAFIKNKTLGTSAPADEDEDGISSSYIVIIIICAVVGIGIILFLVFCFCA